MSNKEKILSKIESDLESLNKVQSFNSQIAKIGKDSAVSSCVIAAFLCATHFGLAALHDSEEYNAVKAQIGAGTFTVPSEYYADLQETCIRTVLADEDKLDLANMSQDEVLSLKDEYSHQLNADCSDKRFSDYAQYNYLQTLDAPSWALNASFAFGAGAGFYFGITAYVASRRRKTQKNIDKKSRDFDLLS